MLHLIELPLYLLLAWSLIRSNGNEGAALAWTARTALDVVLFFAAAWFVLPAASGAIRRLVPALGAVLAACGVGALIPDLAARLVFLAVVALVASVVVWKRALPPDEAAWLLGRFAPRDGARRRRPWHGVDAAMSTPSRAKVCHYTPTPDGGHALYARELLTALRRGRRPARASTPSWSPAPTSRRAPDRRLPDPSGSCRPSSPAPGSARRPRGSGSRLAYYTHASGTFLDWVAPRGDLDLIHFQEFTPWLAPAHWRELPSAGPAAGLHGA